MRYFKVPVTVYMEAASSEEAVNLVGLALRATSGVFLTEWEEPSKLTDESAASLKMIRDIIDSASGEDGTEHPLFPDTPGKTKVRFLPGAVQQIDDLVFGTSGGGTANGHGEGNEHP